MQEKQVGTRFEELRGLVAKATPTPWKQDGSALVHGDLVVAVFGSGYTEAERDDAALAVAAVNELVPLLDRAEAAEAKVARVERLVAGQGGNYLVHPGHIRKALAGDPR